MSEISVLVAGDYSPKERLQKALDDGTYTAMFSGVRDIVSSVDYSIVNFETTVPTVDSKPIPKVGCHLYAKENAFDLLTFLGFRMLTMANNHVMDYGAIAMDNSRRLALNRGFDIVGVGHNLSEARKYKVVHIKGKRIAVINACEHEFSIATDQEAGCNPLDEINLSYDIRSAKEESDYVIVIIHGGHEHYNLPSPRMKKTYRFFVDQGADAVLNHHQHCYSGYEVYHGKPIFYGLGNFCFDSASDIKHRHKTYTTGLMVKLVMSDTIGFELIPYLQCYKHPGVYLKKGQSKNDILNDVDALNAIISDDELLNASFVKLAKSKRDFIFRGFRPYTSRVANALYYRGLLPSFLSDERLMIIKSIIKCESHNEVLTNNLNHS